VNNHARGLFCTLVDLYASSCQQESFKVLMALFLRGDGRPHPTYASGKSASALSRFLNRYAWSARALTRHVRSAAISSLFGYYAHRRGRRSRLLVMLDLSTLEKTGRFEQLGLVSVLNKKRGLHLVVMYLQAGPLRFPWAFRVWRGRGEASPSELALSLLKSLPKAFRRFKPLVLADAGFGTTTFLVGVKRLELDAVVGMRCDRRLQDGRSVSQARSGEQVILLGLPFPVTIARYHLPRDGGRGNTLRGCYIHDCRSGYLTVGTAQVAHRSFLQDLQESLRISPFCSGYANRCLPLPASVVPGLYPHPVAAMAIPRRVAQVG
jgi:hypothetical protein